MAAQAAAQHDSGVAAIAKAVPLRLLVLVLTGQSDGAQATKALTGEIDHVSGHAANMATYNYFVNIE